MTPKTRQIIIAIYWNWCGRGRERRAILQSRRLVGPNSLDREKRAKGLPALTLAQHTWAVGLPLSFLQTLEAALDEGVSDDELRSLDQVRAPTKPFIPS